MKIRILAVGKLKRGPITELMDDLKKRCKWAVQIVEIDHSSKAQESTQLLSHVSAEDHVVVLDERGESMASEDFAAYIDNLQTVSVQRLTFIIGGAFGLEPDLMAKAHKKVAFGCQTWPHMFVRLMLIEQLYRAESILAGHPYHKS